MTIGEELEMTNNFEKAFYEKISKKKIRVAMSVISSMLRSVLVLLPTLFMRRVYNSLELGLDSEGVIGIILLTFVIPLVVGASFSLDIRLSKYIYIIIKEIRIQALGKIIKEKLRTVLCQNKGDLFNRIIFSLEELGDYYYYFINTTTWYITTTIVGIGIMLLINWRITLMLLFFSGLQISCSLIIQKRIERVKALENQLQAEGNNYVTRITTHNAFIKTALLDNTELIREKEWESESWKVCKTAIWNKQIVAILSFLLTMIRTLYLFSAAHYLFLNNNMMKGDFIALNSYIIWLMPVFEGLQECIEDIIKARENKRRINAYLTEEVEESGESVTPEGMLDYIEVTRLNFSYEDTKELLLKDVNFQVKKGEPFYIVGPSGSGKSTLLNVLLGLETEYTGNILYNGCEISQLNDSWLRQNVIMVGQDVDILPTTLRKNVLYSGVHASDKNIIDVLQALKIEYLLDMPGGLDWDMKKDPRALSDGEKKRIAIARAILSRPQALFLDEPTAGLDNINKMEVTKYIEQSIDGVLVIVTHDKVFDEDMRVFRMPVARVGAE